MRKVSKVLHMLQKRLTTYTESLIITEGFHNHYGITLFLHLLHYHTTLIFPTEPKPGRF